MGFGQGNEFGSHGFGNPNQGSKKGETPKPASKVPEPNREFLDRLRKKLQDQRPKPRP